MADFDGAAAFAASPVAVLTTVRPDGSPHVVPVVFAAPNHRNDLLYTAVDATPKTTQRLQRLANIEGNPAVSLLVDHYDDDWSQLWWVRAELRWQGDAATDRASALAAALAGRYPQYRDQPFARVLVLRVVGVSGWAAGPLR